MKKAKFTLEQAMRAQRGGVVEVYLYSSNNLDAVWGGWLTPCPVHFTSGSNMIPIVNEGG
jgi:hypothetical protein